MSLDDLAYPPDKGGRWKVVLLGVGVPLLMAYVGTRAWIDQEAMWPGSRGTSIMVKGDTARAMAVCYLSAAGFCHFRWFWGLVSSYQVFVRGTVVSLLIGIFSFLLALYFAATG